MVAMALRKTIRLHKAQQDFRRSTALYRGFVGGRGAGKSWVGAYDLIRRAKRDRLYMVASPTYTVLSDTTFRTFKDIARSLGTLKEARLSPPSIRLHTGAEILFRSADDPEKLRGPNLSGVWLDEASLMHRDAYDVAIACLRESGEQGWLSSTFTPKGRSHWTYEVFGSNKPHTEIFRAKTRDNPFNPAGFHATLATQYSGLRARQELDGEFCNIEGAEWPAGYFDESIFFTRWPDNLRCKVMALDPSKGRSGKAGDYSAFVILGVDENADLWIDADMDNQRPVEPMVGFAGRSIVGDGIALGQQHRPQAFVIETNGFQEMVALAFHRVARERCIMLPLYTINSTDNKQARIRTLGTYFAQRRAKIADTPGGRLLAQQLSEFPEGEHDDGPDALKMAEQMADYLLNGQGVIGKKQPQALRA